MIRQVSDIMDKNFLTIQALDCVSVIRNLATENKLEYFPVYEDNSIIGVVTYKELIIAHPNRIAADAMTTDFVCIKAYMPVWEVKDLFEQQKVNCCVVVDNNLVVGIVTPLVLKIELGKHIDLLTGLYKNDYLFFNAGELLKSQNDISVVFIDIDNFGIIDKEYGHIFGDKVLKEIALTLNAAIPKKTFLCRFGGDEFVLLVPFKAEVAKKVTENLLSVIAAKAFSNGLKITVSAGISGGKRSNRRITDIYSTVSNLINIASLACTEAKKSDNSLCIKLGEESDIA